MSPEVFRNLLVLFSGLSLGAAGITLLIHLLRFKTNPKLHAVFIFISLAWIGVVGEVFKVLLLPISAIPPTGDGYWYLGALLFGAVGFVCLARMTQKRWL